MKRLRDRGIAVCMIDLTMLDSESDQWCAGFAAMVHEGLDLGFSFRDWWSAQGAFGDVGRLSRYLARVAGELEKPAVIFIDEIDSALRLAISDDFFAAIRACHNARASQPEFRRLTFALVGAATPMQLMRDPRRTPFNVGRQIGLTDLPFEAALAKFAPGLHADPDHARQLLERIYHWTGGHPYLTQRACAELVRADGLADVDAVIGGLYLSGARVLGEVNIKTTSDRLARLSPKARRIYRDVTAGKRVPDEPDSPAFAELRLTGATTSVDGVLQPRNRIYAQLFDKAWIREHFVGDDSRSPFWIVAMLLVRTLIVVSAAWPDQAWYYRLGWALVWLVTLYDDLPFLRRQAARIFRR
jgi:hypothetical protein